MSTLCHTTGTCDQLHLLIERRHTEKKHDHNHTKHGRNSYHTSRQANRQCCLWYERKNTQSAYHNSYTRNYMISRQYTTPLRDHQSNTMTHRTHHRHHHHRPVIQATHQARLCRQHIINRQKYRICTCRTPGDRWWLCYHQSLSHTVIKKRKTDSP